jgi:hypothetical protein
MRTRSLFVLAAAMAVAVLAVDAIVPASATPPILAEPVTPGTPAAAEPILLATDVVSVYQTGPLTAPVRAAALAAAKQVGAPAVVGRGFTGMLTRVRRGRTVLQHTRAAGWVIPMAVTSLPLAAIAGVMGRNIAAPVAAGTIVMGATTASLRGAEQGDIVEFRGSGGRTVAFTIGLVAPDASVGGTEIVMSLEMAAKLGGTIDTRVLIWGGADRAALTKALVARGLFANRKVRIRRSWDAPDPDDTLSLATTKRLLGEFDFDLGHLSTSGWTAMSPQWRAKYLPTNRQTFPTGIHALCNKVIKADLVAALTEVVNSGLSGGVDVGNTNSYGGCGTGQARFARITQALGSVSRHSWAQPLDMNTASNCQGCRPHMDCRIVRIFRKHGFAWGGNFLTSDGMHFEWVGEARDRLKYPSRYCPNVVVARTRSAGLAPPSVAPASSATARATLFAQDGWLGE